MKLSQMENHIKSVCVVAERETRMTTSIISKAYKIMEFIYGQRKLYSRAGSLNQFNGEPNRGALNFSQSQRGIS